MKSHLTSGSRRLDAVSLRNGPSVPHGPRRARATAAPRRRRGVASMLAMLYLVLFSALALGFYASTTMSAQVSRNERTMAEAQRAAESGLNFMRLKLSQVTIPPKTKDADVPPEIYIDLVELMEKSDNLAPRPIMGAGATVSIPAITLSNNTRFSATIQWANGVGRVTVTGLASNGPTAVTRRIQVDCTLRSRGPDILGFGLASQGPIQIKNSGSTRIVGDPDGDASLLSAHPGSTAITTGSGTIEGDLNVTGSPDQVSLGGGSVGGSNYRPDIMENHVHVVPPPEFPTIDTSVFRQYATNTYTGGKAYYKNVLVPPNTNPTFSGGEVIEGILYVQSPNTVKFRGSTQVNGIIVFEDKNGPAENTLDFRGNVSPEAIPNTAEFAAIREAAQGLSILAPKASVTMSGSVDATLTGSLFAHQITLGGSADLHFKNGSLVSLGPQPVIVGGKTVSFTGTGIALPPKTGVTFSGYLQLSPWTYREVY